MFISAVWQNSSTSRNINLGPSGNPQYVRPAYVLWQCVYLLYVLLSYLSTRFIYLSNIINFIAPVINALYSLLQGQAHRLWLFESHRKGQFWEGTWTTFYTYLLSVHLSENLLRHVCVGFCLYSFSSQLVISCEKWESDVELMRSRCPFLPRDAGFPRQTKTWWKVLCRQGFTEEGHSQQKGGNFANKYNPLSIFHVCLKKCNSSTKSLPPISKNTSWPSATCCWRMWNTLS